MVVHRPGEVPDRVSRREAPRGHVQHRTDHGARHGTQLHAPDDRVAGLAEGGDPPRHDLHPTHPVVVLRPHDQRLPQVDRRQGVGPRKRDLDAGRLVGHDLDLQGRRRRRRGASRGVLEPPRVRAGAGGRPPALEAVVPHLELHRAAPFRVHQRAAADLSASPPPKREDRSRGHRQRRRFVPVLGGGHPGVRRIGRLEHERGHEQRVHRRQHVERTPRAVGRLGPVARLGGRRRQRRAPLARRQPHAPGARDLSRRLPAKHGAVPEGRPNHDLHHGPARHFRRAGLHRDGRKHGSRQHGERVQQAGPGRQRSAGQRQGDQQHQGRRDRDRRQPSAHGPGSPLAQDAGELARVAFQPVAGRTQRQVPQRRRRARRHGAREFQGTQRLAFVQPRHGVHGPGDSVLRPPAPRERPPPSDPGKHQGQRGQRQHERTRAPGAPSRAAGQQRRQRQHDEHADGAPRGHGQGQAAHHKAAHARHGPRNLGAAGAHDAWAACATAKTKMFTPMRRAASRVSSGSSCTSASSQPSPRSVS